MLVGEIEITELDDSYGPEDGVFKLTRRDDGAIDISNPLSWIGYEGPVRGLGRDGDSIDLRQRQGLVLVQPRLQPSCGGPLTSDRARRA